MTSRLLNVLLYQTGWFLCVLGASRGVPGRGAAAAAVLLVTHLALARCRRDEVLLALVAGAAGMGVDSLQQAAGLLHFAGGSPRAWLAPPWIGVLWMQLAGTMHFCLSWLAGRYRLAGVVGLAGGPLAFEAGRRLGAVSFHPSVWPSLVVLALVWALLLPLLVRLADRLRGERAGSYVGLA